jgi:hypothetical protein
MGYLNPNLDDFNLKLYQEIYDNKINEDDNDLEKFRNLSEEITYKNIQRILLIVLILVGLIPVFNLQTYYDTLSGQRTALV